MSAKVFLAYSGLLLIGFALGRGLHSEPRIYESDGMIVNDLAMVDEEHKGRSTPKFNDSEQSQGISQPDVKQNNKGEKSEHPTAERILELVLLDESDFEAFRRNRTGAYKSLISDFEVAISLLEHLPHITDSRARWRIKQLLSTAQYEHDFTGMLRGEATRIESWLLQQIETYNFREHYLEVLSEIGMQSKDNLEYVISQLSFEHGSDNKAHLLNAVNRSMIQSTLSVSDMEKLVQQTEPYLSHRDERVRAAAVASLRSVFSTESLEANLMNALDDPSSLVRTRAGDVVAAKQLRSDQFRQRFFEAMQDEERDASERFSAAMHLSLFPLAQEEMAQLVKFRETEFDQLLQQIRQENPWEQY